MLKRVLSAVLMVPLLMGAILYPNPSLFQLLCWLCIGVGLVEFFTMVWPEQASVSRLIAAGFGMVIVAFWIMNGQEHIQTLPFLVLVITAAFFLVLSHGRLEGAHHRLGHFLFGILYVGALGVHVALIRRLDDGVYWIFSLLAATWFNDTAAYFAGRRFGKHRLAPRLSPGKTWEGWFGGLMGSALGVFAFWVLIPNPLSVGEALALVGIAAVFGPLGDLCESLLKRSSGVKDSGHIIPGHGGILDRIDALLFTAPLFYYFAVWVVY